MVGGPSIQLVVIDRNHSQAVFEAVFVSSDTSKHWLIGTSAVSK